MLKDQDDLNEAKGEEKAVRPPAGAEKENPAPRGRAPREEEPPEDAFWKEWQRKQSCARKGKKLFAAAAVCLGVAALAVVCLVPFGGGGALMLLCFLPAVAGIVLFCVGLKNKLASLERPRSVLPIFALAADLACVPLALLGGLAVVSSFFTPLGLLLLLAAIAAPIAGIVIAVAALGQGREKIGAWGVGLSIAAIVLPIVALVTVIALFSTGVFVISLM